MSSALVNANDRTVDLSVVSAATLIYNADFLADEADDIVVVHMRSGAILATLSQASGDYTVSGLDTASGFTITINDSNVTLADGDVLRVYGDMVIQRQTDFIDTGDFLAAAINSELDRYVMMLQEFDRDALKLDVANDAYSAGSKKIINVAEGTADTDGVNKAQVVTLVGENLGDLTVYVTQAEGHANDAAAEVVLAQAEVASAAAHVATALSHANTASAAQVSAEAARDATLAAYDNFDDRYLGEKASDPTVDNDGDALAAGMIYFNTTTNAMLVYTGSAWVAAYVSGGGFLAAASNLSDVASPSAARGNLGLTIGTDVQAYSAKTAAIASLTWAANKLMYFTGTGTAATIDLLSWARTFLASSSLANGLAALGLGTGDSPQFTGVNLGHASDTTVTRSEAGVIAVEGLPIFSGIPQNSQSSDYTLVLADAQKQILHPSADTTARTFTIPANASVAYPVGTVITFINQDSAGTLTIAITTDTMRLADGGETGNRTLADNGVAVAFKVTATEWLISGNGLT